mgnify:CR=1 FL=1
MRLWRLTRAPFAALQVLLGEGVADGAGGRLAAGAQIALLVAHARFVPARLRMTEEQQLEHGGFGFRATARRAG